MEGNQIPAETLVLGGATDKAAVLLLSMGEAAAAKVFQRLSREEVEALSQRMANLSRVSTLEARGVLEQFFGDYREHSGISAASRQYLERTLDLALGGRLARSMVDSLYGDELRSELQRLQWIPPEALARCFRAEHPQLQAVLLAFLPPDTASAVLAARPAASHDDLLLRVANLKEVSEPVLLELRACLERCLQQAVEQASASVDGARQAADIINRFQGDRAYLIEMHKLHDQDAAVAVEENMYDFVTLGRQSEDVLQQIVQEIQPETLALALKGAEPAVRRTLLAAVPKRMAQAIETSVSGLGLVPLRKVEQARTEIMQRIRQLHEQGELEYQLFEERVVG
jgi:flagellar motor switch protein FliG